MMVTTRKQRFLSQQMEKNIGKLANPLIRHSKNMSIAHIKTTPVAFPHNLPIRIILHWGEMGQGKRIYVYLRDRKLKRKANIKRKEGKKEGRKEGKKEKQSGDMDGRLDFHVSHAVCLIICGSQRNPSGSDI